MMTPERWRDIERLYHEARQRDPTERAAFLRAACAGDELLHADVESLLARREEADGFLEVPAAEVAARAGARESVAPETGSGGDADSRRGTGSGPGFVRGRPWWAWCCVVLVFIAACGIYWVLLTGPEPAGWMLMPLEDDGSAWSRRTAGVSPGSPADRAGFLVNDLLSGGDIARFLTHQQPNVAHRLDVLRDGTPRTLILTLGPKDRSYWLRGQGRLDFLLMLTAPLYLGLAALLILSRPHDRSARWGALLIAQIGVLGLQHGAALILRLVPEAAHAVRSLPLPVAVCVLISLSVAVMVPAGAFGFCAVFPRPLPLGRWAWWALGLAASTTISIDLVALWLPVFSGAPAVGAPIRLALAVPVGLGLVYLTWALALLTRNYRSVEGRNERRRLRIVALGFAVSLFAMAVLIIVSVPWAPIEEFRFRHWTGSPWQLLHLSSLAITPICIAYAILRHRVFDIHVMVRLGVRYAVARGVLLSLVPATGLVLALDVLTHREQAVSDIVGRRGLWYLGLGVGAMLLHARRKTWMDALDRRFFREHYDAHRLLSGVVDDLRRAEGFGTAAGHVIARIDGALHPESVSLMVRKPGDSAFRAVAGKNTAVLPVPADTRLVGLARALEKPLEIPLGRAGRLQDLPRSEVELLRRMRIEWLFPVSLGAAPTEAFLLLGPKQSEEPYSREDRDLLVAIAHSLGLVLERPAGATAVRPGFAECTACGTCYDSGTAGCADHGETLIRSPYSRVVAGRYRLDRRLGRGGMGTVYEAFDTELEREVAVKVIRSEVMESPEAIGRFRREAKAAASLSHPHVVTVHDFGIAEDDRAYLVMERLEGRSLREELQEQGSLEPARVMRILDGVGAAVTLAHQRRLLHRDLKPENIFLAQGEDGEVAKILDFGLVRPLTPGATESVAHTAPGALVGTLAYMSPEQRRGDAPAESWDIWALAVVALEMLTGVHPFAGSSAWEPALPRGGDHASGSGARPLTASAEAFFGRALSIDPSQRPSSIVQFVEELEAALSRAGR